MEYGVLIEFDDGGSIWDDLIFCCFGEVIFCVGLVGEVWLFDFVLLEWVLLFVVMDSGSYSVVVV